MLVTHENQHGTEVHSSSPNLEHEVSPLIQDRRVDSPPIEDSSSLRDRGSHISVSQSNIGSPLRRNECGKIPRRYFQIEEDMFLCTPLEIDEPTSF